MSFNTLHNTFSMTDEDFERIRGWVRDLIGIKLSDAKRQMVYARLTRRLRIHGFGDFGSYLDYVESGVDDELVHFKNAITTNLTSFFREPHHFEYMENTILPEIKIRAGAGKKEIRVWSAGCSTGEEAYSIAMTVDRVFSPRAGWDIKILATDIDTNVLHHGKEAVYQKEKVKTVSEELIRDDLEPVTGDSNVVRVKKHLRNMVVFNQLNLMAENWPMKKKFDIIFCRNVMIYFDKPTQHRLVTRYWNLLKDDGYLLLGHSESLFGVNQQYKLMGKNIYKKIQNV